MNILGITHPISHNSSACLIKNGELIAIGEEERFIREKHAPRVFPENSIKFCMELGNISPEDIDVVAVGFGEKNFCGGPKSGIMIKKCWSLASKGLKKIGIPESKVSFFSHHLCHMISAFACSGQTQWSNIMSIDGAGDDCSGFLSNSEGLFTNPHSCIDSARNTHFPSHIIDCSHSWGLLWEYVTQLLGFRRHSGEGKTMGLASYGVKLEPNALPPFFSKEGYPDTIKFKKFFANKGWGIRVEPVTGSKLSKAYIEPLSNMGKNTAYTLQKYYNDWLVSAAKEMYTETNCKKFSLCGGCALNCTANGHLASQDFVKEIYIQPLSHDGGTALGAAILAHWIKYKKFPKATMPHAYWGKEFSQKEIEDALKKSDLPIHPHPNPAQITADLLADNKVVCLFQGRAEVGPRALGNRSILANPTYKSNLDRVNKIKGRESWRPLAPSILKEDYFNIVDAKFESPFMLMAAQVKESYKDKIPAVVHVDNSCRPQTVDKETNPIFHKIILEFKKRTGIPVVLNTSYNLSHEPIVNSPEDAIKTFMASDTDALVMGNHIVKK